MTTALAIMQLVAQLAPPAIELANNLIKSHQASDMTDEEFIKLLTTLQGELKPMELKV